MECLALTELWEAVNAPKPSHPRLKPKPSAGGAKGAVVRADSLDHLTGSGWSALEAYGVRTIVDLRNDESRRWPSFTPTGKTSAFTGGDRRE